MALIAFILFSPLWPLQVRLSLYWWKTGSLVQRQSQCRFLAKADGNNLHLHLGHETELQSVLDTTYKVFIKSLNLVYLSTL